MKEGPRQQVLDWLAARDGLARNGDYMWHQWSEQRKKVVRALFRQRNR
jgi:hypothetical protein